MTKKLTVEEQIDEAKKSMEQWPDLLKKSTHLEGHDPYIEKTRKSSLPEQSPEGTEKKE